MVKIKKVNMSSIDRIIDFVYQLSIDNATASYTRMHSKKSVENELIRRIDDKSSNLLAIYNEIDLIGVCAYYWIDKDNYLQTTIFLFSNPSLSVLDLAIKTIKSKRENHRLLIGLPTENKRVSILLSQLGELTEQSINFVYDSKGSKYESNENIVEIDRHNSSLYQAYHDSFALKHEIYWHADNLIKSIDDFGIFAYVKNKEILGSIFYRKGKIHQEIFGLLYDGFKEDINKVLLKKVLEQVNQESEEINLVYFIDMNATLEIRLAKEVGFRVQDTYTCFDL